MTIDNCTLAFNRLLHLDDDEMYIHVLVGDLAHEYIRTGKCVSLEGEGLGYEYDDGLVDLLDMAPTVVLHDVYGPDWRRDPRSTRFSTKPVHNIDLKEHRTCDCGDSYQKVDLFRPGLGTYQDDHPYKTIGSILHRMEQEDPQAIERLQP